MNFSSIDELISYGFTDRVSELYKDFPDLEPARVVRVDRQHLRVITAHGLALVKTAFSCATGDWVGLSTNDSGEAVVSAVLPRSSQLVRKAAFDLSTESQVLAANVDFVGVVVPIDRAHSPGRLERMLVAAWDSGATPLVILTKADLADGVNGNDDVVSAVIEQAPGVQVITTSAEQGDGIDALRAEIPPGATLTFLGPSGAGKSSLINALVGSHQQDTGAVRDGDFKGKHTTTSRELIPLAGGAVLMDAPGVRGFEVADAGDGMSKVFEDIEELFENCRFNDCQHRFEPGCAVQEALDSGSLEQRRWESYQKMGREMARLAKRKDTALRRADSRSAGKAYKSFKKIRDQSRAEKLS